MDRATFKRLHVNAPLASPPLRMYGSGPDTVLTDGHIPTHHEYAVTSTDKMLYGDGAALISTNHPPGPHPPSWYGYGEDIPTAAVSRIVIEQDPDQLIPQAFYVKGERVLHRRDACNLLPEHDWTRAQIADLLKTLIAWLAIQLPVAKWRREPEVTMRSDFGSNAQIVELSGRGFLDLYVRAGDHRAWLVEL